jgi:hypothetical protein
MSDPSLLLVVPSRHRPHNLRRFLASYEPVTAMDLLVVLDSDDYYDYCDIRLPARARTLVLPEMRTVPKLNEAILPQSGAYDLIMYAGDDTVPVTPGWDRLMLERFGRDGSGYYYPEDHRRNDIPEHVMISTDIIRALGWFALPCVSHFLIDDAWARIGNACGCLHFMPEVVFEHLHYVRGLAPHDEIYKRSEEWGPDDGVAYQNWLDSGQAERDIRIVREVTARG